MNLYVLIIIIIIIINEFARFNLAYFTAKQI